MSNWDLMMPGMGLTAIGLTGVTIAFSGIAHTFVDGMHALTGLTLMIGLIFLATGILDGGGISTSNKAKATTLVILGIGFSFAVVGVTASTITTLPTFAGVMLIVAIPSIVMAYVSMKMPQYAKPIGIIFVLATGAAIAAYVGFGLYGPSQYLVPPPEPVEEEKAPAAPTAPITAISILKDSSIQGNPDFDPDVVQVPVGNIIEWTNDDSVTHTVTSAADAGSTFDSSLIQPGAKFDLDTTKLKEGTYEYMCVVHPWMNASFVLGGAAPATPAAPEVAISILKDSATQGNPDYDPDTTQITKGDTIVWTNNDNAMHTVTSSDGKSFSSDPLKAGDVFKVDTTKLDLGKYDYACSFHPWMTASFELVEKASEQKLAEGATTTEPTAPETEPAVPAEAPAETPTETTPEAPVAETPAETPSTGPPVQEPAPETPTETPTESANTVTVEMAAGAASNQDCADQCFVPNIAHVAVGGTVTWKNVDSAAHTATEMNNKFDSSMVMANGQFSQKFDEAGTFDYMCIVHPWMKGQVIAG